MEESGYETHWLNLYHFFKLLPEAISKQCKPCFPLYSDKTFIATGKRCNVTRPFNLPQMEPCLKLHLSGFSGQNMFTGYGEQYVVVNQARYEHSLIVLPDRIIEGWEAVTFEQLTAEHFDFLLSLQPEMVLFGTGATLRFPHPTLTRSLIESGVGVEVMDTNAACRTYNILTAEGRRVAAALLI
jgi:uncharacterized protein